MTLAGWRCGYWVRSGSTVLGRWSRVTASRWACWRCETASPCRPSSSPTRCGATTRRSRGASRCRSASAGSARCSTRTPSRRRRAGIGLTLDDDDVDASRFERLVERGRVLVAARRTGPCGRDATAGRWRCGGERRSTDLDGWLPGRSEASPPRGAAPVGAGGLARRPSRRRRAPRGRRRGRAVGRRGTAARASLGDARAGAVPLRPAGRRACDRWPGAPANSSSELGLEPGAELIELEAAILRQDPALAPVAEHRRSVSAACPYKGLAPYDEADSEAFFGRDDETCSVCLDDSVRHRCSWLRDRRDAASRRSCGPGWSPPCAGRGRGRPVVHARSGPRRGDGPVERGPRRGAGARGRPVRGALHPRTRPSRRSARSARRSPDTPLETAPVVIAVRSDQLGGLSVDAELSSLAERGLHLVAPLAGEALREAIEQPALLAGLRLEHGLVDLLVRDCEGEPGGLPLLSHALAETWRRRDGADVDGRGYRDSGGIRGAVARSADRLYDGLSAERAGHACARFCCASSARRPTATRCAAGCPAERSSASPDVSA